MNGNEYEKYQQQARCLFHKKNICCGTRMTNISNRQDACSTKKYLLWNENDQYQEQARCLFHQKKFISCGTGILPVAKKSLLIILQNIR